MTGLASILLPDFIDLVVHLADEVGRFPFADASIEKMRQFAGGFFLDGLQAGLKPRSK